MNRLFRIVGILLIAVGAATVASAQITVPGVPMPQLPRLPVGTDPVTGTLRTATSALTEARKLRVRELLHTERATVESDPDGQPILRRQVGALSPTPAALERARAAGFTVLRTESLDALGLILVVLEAPDGMSTRHALKALRELDPEGQYDYNHLYLDAGAESEVAAAVPQSARLPAVPSDARIGLIDSGVDGAHPVLANANIVRHGCDGATFPAPHGTAVASILVGQGEAFGASSRARRSMPPTSLRTWRARSLLAVELDWMARERIAVVNISLVGAKSLPVDRLVRAMTSRGFLLVAAVGNDGPSCSAALSRVVSGCHRRDRRGCVIAGAAGGSAAASRWILAAAGAGFSAAAVGGGYEPIRGTSFATPIVAGLLARSLQAPNPANARAAVEALAATAIDIGNNGTDPSYGKGLVGGDLHPGHREEN
jgi:hypothetical protein